MQSLEEDAITHEEWPPHEVVQLLMVAVTGLVIKS
jgi:hypothetical protein